MPLNFPASPSNGDTYGNYVYDATAGVWNVKLVADQNLEDLDNVNITAPVDGQALIYDATNTEWVAGDVSTGTEPAKIIDSNSINVDFSDGIELEKRTVTGDVTFTGSNYTSGVKKTIYLEGDTAQRNLTFPVDWTFLTDKPTAIGANRKNILDLNSFGTLASTTVGIWLGQSAFEPISMTGGAESTIVVDGVTYKVHTFASTGSYSVSNLGSDGTVEYLIVAGGGSGGNRIGGGGGAGGVIIGSGSIAAGTFSAVVGSGGAAQASNANGNNGGNSSFLGLTAIGGGGGGTTDGFAGSAGGSGGGGGRYGPANGGTGTAGQGNSGGASSAVNANPDRSGGGGGAGSSGSSGPTSGNGGVGITSNISGTLITYAGGGGGSSWNGAARGIGGSGGGGNGAESDSVGTAGTANTGGGGGGGGYPNNLTGLAGGSGIIIVRYPITDPN